MTDLMIEPMADMASPEAKDIVAGLMGYNQSRAPASGWQFLGYAVKDGQGHLVGGILGYTHWNWLFITHLWVTEAQKGRGLGTRLVRMAETEAVARQCLHAHVDTFDFQARGFYEKLGYELFGELEDYPVGHRRFFLRRHLLSGA